MKLLRNLALYIGSFLGPMLLTLVAQTQAPFPSLGDASNLKNWFITFGVGAVFTVAFWLIKRFINASDNLVQSVRSLELTVGKSKEREKMIMAQISNVVSEQNKLANRVNGHDDWRNKHDNYHAHCDHCPPENQ